MTTKSRIELQHRAEGALIEIAFTRGDFDALTESSRLGLNAGDSHFASSIRLTYQGETIDLVRAEFTVNVD